MPQYDLKPVVDDIYGLADWVKSKGLFGGSQQTAMVIGGFLGVAMRDGFFTTEDFQTVLGVMTGVMECHEHSPQVEARFKVTCEKAEVIRGRNYY